MVSEERDVKSFVLSVVFPIKRKENIGDPHIGLIGAYQCLPEKGDRLKHVQQESAAICHLCTGEGVMSTRPIEQGQLPKGVQPGFIEEVVDDDESATMAAI